MFRILGRHRIMAAIQKITLVVTVLRNGVSISTKVIGIARSIEVDFEKPGNDDDLS